MPQKVILDCDPGTDDAIAIMLAALSKEIDLIGITTVNGNAPVEFCSQNALRVLEAIGHSHTPVYEGQARPLIRPDFPVPRVQCGLIGKTKGVYLDIPPATIQKHAQSAVEFLVETYRSTSDPIVLVPTAPLTNIASALTLEPKLKDMIAEIVLMGGSHAICGATPAAEFNIWVDPEAASLVFNAGFPKLTVIPLDATYKAQVSLNDCTRFASLGTPAGLHAAQLIEQRIQTFNQINGPPQGTSSPVHDGLCIAHLIKREVVTLKPCRIDVELKGDHTLGATIMDWRGKVRPNCNVAIDADRTLYRDILEDTFSKGPCQHHFPTAADKSL
ncbi:nucleoside hydrolase [Flexibacterium corallicola]|uniref:nucleoside hydrolase n=1 Tax=Flexibacterium corallicola TaxID=3037259 RepID=UPI00286F0AFB|nr:nucleoside hydrolase [Pseudovibrio sp. M1P-2-3]